MTHALPELASITRTCCENYHDDISCGTRNTATPGEERCIDKEEPSAADRVTLSHTFRTKAVVMSGFFVNGNDTSDNATRTFEYHVFSAFLPASIQFVLCSMAVAAIIRVPALRQGQNLFMVNLVISDILRTVVGVWVFPVFFFRLQAVTEGDIISCKIFLFLWDFQFFWSMWGTVLIAYSRYSTVSRPLEANITTRKAAIAIGCTCATGVIIALLPFFGWAQYDIRYKFSSQSYVCSLTENKKNQAMSFSIFYYGLAYATPLALVSVFLSKTLRKVITSARIRRTMTYNAKPDRVEAEASSGGQSMARSKALWYVIAVVASNVILPAPYVAVQLINTTILVDGGVQAVTGIIFSLNFVVNALLYVFWAKTFMQSLADVLCCRRLRQK